MKRFFPLIAVILALGASLFAPSCANTTQSPTGGPKDSIPPYIVDIKPLPGEVNVPLKDMKVVFSFNEYVKIAKPSSIYLSPPQEKAPKSYMRDRKLVVEFQSDLEPNTTYVLNLNDAIADNNEGNQFPGFSYVFSTGPTIDSMMVTGTVLDSKSLKPVKNATVVLHTDPSDSAVFLRRPYAAGMTDDWGFFYIPYIKDTVYSMYAILDQNADSKLDPLLEDAGFVATAVRPVMHASDTVPELMKYDMKDTVACKARRSEYELRLFREIPTAQSLKDYRRTSPNTAYLSFHAPYVRLDSLVVEGYEASSIITQFDDNRDSLLIWVNDRYDVRDTLRMSLKYGRTAADGSLEPYEEKIKLVMDKELAAKFSPKAHAKKTHQDSISVYRLEARPETVEEDGFTLTFEEPLVYEHFDSIRFWSVNPRQQKTFHPVKVTRDSLNLLVYHLKPDVKGYREGYEYYMKVPHHAFRGMSGKYTDSTEVRISLPSDTDLCSLRLRLSGVRGRYVVDLLAERGSDALRSYVVTSDRDVEFRYLQAGKYRVRVSYDVNGNGFIDPGTVIGKKAPEPSRYLLTGSGTEYLDLPAGSEVEQEVSLEKLFRSE